MDAVLVGGQSVSLEGIRKKLLEERSLDIALLSPDVVERVIRAHLSWAGTSDLDDYVLILEENEGEYQSLVSDLVAPADRFFADRELTSLLTDELLPPLLADKGPNGGIRIWVANAGEGYIAYDVALAVQRLKDNSADLRSIRIIAGFSDEETARRARWRDFPAERLAELGRAWPDITDVDKALLRARNLIVFARHDLLTMPPYANTDLIVCPGYLPLLHADDRGAAAAKLVHSLRQRGVLLLGRGEIPPIEAPSPAPHRPFATFTKQIPHPYELPARLFVSPSTPVALLDKLTEPVIIVGRDGRIIATNAEASALRTDGALREASLKSALPGELGAALERATRELLHAGDHGIAVEHGVWTVGLARVPAPSVEAVTAIALMNREPCESHSTATDAEYRHACRQKAIKTAELAAQVWVSESHVEQLTRQAAAITENLYTRNQQLASLTEEAGRRNQQLREANERLQMAVADRDAAQRELKAAFEREHNIADTLQKALLPELAERIEGYSVGVLYQAAAEEADVGGDFYHGMQVDEYSHILALGDVAGKGLAAAVLGAMSKYMMVGFAAETPDPAVLLLRLNEALVTQTSDLDFAFVTLACLLLNTQTDKVYYASGGHEPIMLYRKAADRVELLYPTGKALGILGGHTFTSVEIEMAPGDFLFIYTDGLPDAGVPDNPLTVEGLAQVVKNEATRPPLELLDAVYETAFARGGGRLRDDAAGLLLKRDEV